MIFLLYGQDSFRRKAKIKELKAKFKDKVDPLGQSLSLLNGANIKAQDLDKQINTGSLFVQKRMTIIENIFNNKDEHAFQALLSICSKKKDSNEDIIIFNEDEIKITLLNKTAKKLYNWLLQCPYVQEFKPLNNARLASFAKKIIEEKGGQIDASSLSALISKTGNDLWRLNNEIDKLIFSSSNKIINKDLIEKMVSGEVEENIFALIDALVSKNNSLALRLLEEQSAAGISEEHILAMLQRQIKIILEIKKLQTQKIYQEKELAQILKVHPFVVKKSMQQSKNFQIAELESYWQSLLELDSSSKQGQADIKSKIYSLIIN